MALLILTVLGVLLLPLASCATNDGNGTKSHIMFVLVDDWGWANLGLHNPGNPEVVTPNINALIAEGILLDRHYVYKICSPSRCALQSGRNPIHVNVLNDDVRFHNPLDPIGGQQGIPLNMTTIATKLKAAGYTTHAAGKWNAGMAHPIQTPHGRGYDSALTYFDYDTDFWTENRMNCGTKSAPVQTVDMWDTLGPGYGLNGSLACNQTAQSGCTYQDDVFVTRIEEVIANYTPAAGPLFLFWAPHAPHDPYEVPNAYLTKPEFSGINQTERQFYSAMVNVLDDNFGRVVAALKAKGIWDSMLVVVSSDNGGPIGSGYGGNNWPLRGGKASIWEGGVRVNAFVTGGAVPPARRGTVESGLIAIEDWYATFCAVAGVSPDDPIAAAAGLPPPDGMDMWPLISGANATSPRTYVFMGNSDGSQNVGNTTVQGVLRSDGYKLLTGSVPAAFWTGPVFPNSSVYPSAVKQCGEAPGCLYNVFSDPYESLECSMQYPAIAADLLQAIKDARKHVYNPNRGSDDGLACSVAMSQHGGFIGPFLP